MAKENKNQLPEDIQEVENTGVVDSVIEDIQEVENTGVVDSVIEDIQEVENTGVVDSVIEGIQEVGNAAVVSGEGLVKIRVLVALAGKFLLPDNPGAEIEINENQGREIVESGYGEYVNL